MTDSESTHEKKSEEAMKGSQAQWGESEDGKPSSGSYSGSVGSNRRRGLASASEETRERVAREGGEAVSQDRGHMAEIGRKGGVAVSEDREHMSEIGKKGGEARGGQRRAGNA